MHLFIYSTLSLLLIVAITTLVLRRRAIKKRKLMPAPEKIRINSISDAYDLIGNLQPTAWSNANALTPEERSESFFLYQCNDLRIIRIAQEFIRIAVENNKDVSRVAFARKVETHQFAKSFDITANYYHWLFQCVFHQLQGGQDLDLQDYPLPVKDFSADFCSLELMIKAQNLSEY